MTEQDIAGTVVGLVDMRRIGSGDDYSVHRFRTFNDADAPAQARLHEYMLWLQGEGWEVLNIRFEENNDLDIPWSFNLMTFINKAGEHVEDAPDVDDFDNPENETGLGSFKDTL